MTGAQFTCHWFWHIFIVKSESRDYHSSQHPEDRKLPISLSSQTTCDISSSSNLSTSHSRQIYDNPKVFKIEQPSSSSTISDSSCLESQSLMPPPRFPPSALKRNTTLLESQLMPPPKVIPSGHGDVRGSSLANSNQEFLTHPSTSHGHLPVRISSNYSGSGHDKEEIGKIDFFPPQPVERHNIITVISHTITFELVKQCTESQVGYKIGYHFYLNYLGLFCLFLSVVYSMFYCKLLRIKILTFLWKFLYIFQIWFLIYLWAI